MLQLISRHFGPATAGYTAIVKDSFGSPSRLYTSALGNLLLASNGEVRLDADGSFNAYVVPDIDYVVRVYAPNGQYIETESLAGIAGVVTISAKDILDITTVALPTTNEPLSTALASKQSTLVSSTNIKTVGGSSILGSGDVPFPVTTVAGKTGAVTLSSTDLSDFSTAADDRITSATGTSIASLVSGKIPLAQIPDIPVISPTLTANTTLGTTSRSKIRLANTSAGGFTITLPSNIGVDVLANDTYFIADPANSWSTANSVTMTSTKYESVVQTVILDSPGRTIGFKYVDSTTGWLVLK
jgi:hypothetical protein